MVNFKRSKFGFSLFEACIVMLIVGIFFAFSSKVFTSRMPQKNRSIMRGWFACYYRPTSAGAPSGMTGTMTGPYCQQSMKDGIKSELTCKNTVCEFDLPAKIPYLYAYAVAPGCFWKYDYSYRYDETVNTSGSPYYGGIAGELLTQYYPSMKGKVKITPGYASHSTSTTIILNGASLTAKYDCTTHMPAQSGQVSHLAEIARFLGIGNMETIGAGISTSDSNTEYYNKHNGGAILIW